MSDYYAPTVTLDGKLLDTSRRIYDVTVLSGLEMTWGCGDWLTDVEPGKLTIRLLDPAGELLPLVGAIESQPISVGRIDGIVWEGWLEDAEADLVELTNPDTGGSSHVWEVTLTATDVLGQLAADRKHGPPPNEISTAPKNQTHWGPDSMGGRRRALRDRTTVPIRFVQPSGFGNEENTWSIDGRFAPIAGYEKQANVSVLSVLHRTMRAVDSLHRPYYLHSTREIVETMPPTLDQHTGVTIAVVEGMIDLAQYGDGPITAVALLDGSDYSADEGIRIVADPSSRITTVQRTGRREKIEADAKGQPALTYEDESQQITTGAKQREVCTASYETDLSPEWWATVAPIAQWARPTWWADVHRKTAPGTIVYRQPVTAAENPTAQLAFMRPEPVTKTFEDGNPTFPSYTYWTMLYSFQLVRSLTNLLPNSREFAIVGGRLTYSAITGWSHDLTTAPAGHHNGITPTPTLGDVTTVLAIKHGRPGLRIADLTRITHL